MEREELFEKVEESLGSTQLTSLSEETINAELDAALEEVEDDANIDEKFIEKLTKRLVRMEGNLHKNVSIETKKYKTELEKKLKRTPKGNDEGHKEPKGEESETTKLLKEMREELEELKNAQKENATAKKKNDIAAAVKKGIKAKFKEAEIEENSYILKQTIKELDIKEDSDVEELIKKLEKNYYKNLKEAGLDKSTTPRFGGRNKGGKGGTAADRFFARKKAKEKSGSK